MLVLVKNFVVAFLAFYSMLCAEGLLVHNSVEENTPFVVYLLKSQHILLNLYIPFTTLATCIMGYKKDANYSHYITDSYS